ncbi:hypothetical protein HXX76_016092 [Chlamydomonas incerta]|uniref:Uncharacterized protein n=1 Tax=Chlamydomonas incerta TaxID=51695 RepID=A0A835VMG8_CHLIN|nr:hypothetical protein HXX76_016092 [Chlamydomonas incerta]|eukprot:KAG2422367.1 hypothetical protein HXX76_016092 [Chlamydomonas incerta]
MSSTDPVPGLPGFKFTELEPFERQVKTQLHKFELQQHGGGALKVSTVLSYLDAIIPSDSAWRNWHDDQVATLEADAAKWCKDAHDAKHQGQQSPPACPPLCGKKLFDYYLHLLNQHFKRERSKYYSIKFESASMGGNDPRSYLSELRKCEGHVTDLSKRRVVKKFFEGLPDRLRERVLSTVPTHEDLGDLYGQLPALADTAHALWSLMLDMGYSLAHSDQAKPKQEKPASSSATPQGKGGNHSSNSPYGNPYRIGSQRRTAAATTAAARTTSQGEQGSAIDEEALYQRLRADFESRFAAASTSSGGAGRAAGGAPRTKYEADKAKKSPRAGDRRGGAEIEGCEHCLMRWHKMDKCPLIDPNNAPYPEWEPRNPALKAVFLAMKANQAQQEEQRKAAATAQDYDDDEEEGGYASFVCSLVREPACEPAAAPSSSNHHASATNAQGQAGGQSKNMAPAANAVNAPVASIPCGGEDSTTNCEVLLAFNRELRRLADQKPVNIFMSADSGVPAQSAYATLMSQPTPAPPAQAPILSFEAPKASKPATTASTAPKFSVNVTLSGSAASILSRLSLLMQPDIPPAPNEPTGAASSANATTVFSVAADTLAACCTTHSTTGTTTVTAELGGDLSAHLSAHVATSKPSVGAEPANSGGTSPTSVKHCHNAAPDKGGGAYKTDAAYASEGSASVKPAHDGGNLVKASNNDASVTGASNINCDNAAKPKSWTYWLVEKAAAAAQASASALNTFATMLEKEGKKPRQCRRRTPGEMGLVSWLSLLLILYSTTLLVRVDATGGQLAPLTAHSAIITGTHLMHAASTVDRTVTHQVAPRCEPTV